VDEHLLPWLQDAAARNTRVLYVALGTLANGFLTAASVGTLLDAFAELGKDWQVLWSLPEAQHRLLDECGRQYDPSRLRVEKHVRQRAVLAHPAVQVFLTHGGQSSTNESIVAALPVVCMPLFCDQYEVAEAVSRHGLGSVFHKDELLDGNHARLATLLLRSASEPRFRAMARLYANLMKIRGGCTRAAEVIESIVHAGVDFQELWRGLPEEDIKTAVDSSSDTGASSNAAASGGA
jgi:UDP:flavonoid glycosyltransferase YjiC (YdhE family)